MQMNDLQGPRILRQAHPTLAALQIRERKILAALQVHAKARVLGCAGHQRSVTDRECLGVFKGLAQTDAPIAVFVRRTAQARVEMVREEGSAELLRLVG